MLQLKHVKKIYATEEVETAALNGVSLEVAAGEFLAVMGPSGCGKSTLLNLVGLLDKPSSGQLFFLGQEVSGFSEKKRAALRRENIGFIFQSFNLIDELNVYENIELPLLYLNVPARLRKARVEEMLEQLQIQHRRGHFPQQLSGGQQQRVAIARAMISRPKLILADEPTGNLDSRSGEEVMLLLSELNRQGATVMMVTHSLYDASYAHRLIHLFDGVVVSEKRIPSAAV
jgi:putative ABC transport system ATP-binding protein